MSDWTAVFPVSQLPVGGAKVAAHGRDQVAVFRVATDELYAVDNRCPHEGYPLVQGQRTDCTLTCCWHNYKFDLRDGSCLKGDEAVRTFPVRVVDGQVELDLTPPDLSLAVPAYWESLAEGIGQQRVGQAVRDSVRLLDAGVEPAEIAAFVAAFNGDRAEWGATHVVAVAADVLQWAERYAGPRFAIPLAQLIDLAARDGVRRPVHGAVPAVDPGDDPIAAGQELSRLVEAEEGAAAEALLRGALARGWGRSELEPWFFRICSDHFLSFGHRLIYQIKVFDLLEAAGWQHAPSILCGHLRGVVNGTREDVLPAWKGFMTRLQALDLDALYAVEPNPLWKGREQLVDLLVRGTPKAVMEGFVGAMSAGAPREALVDAISLGAAERLLRFDVAIDSDPSNQDTWLSVTHTQTFANAVRHAIRRFDDPAILRLILFAARFVHHHRVLDGLRASVSVEHTEALRGRLMDLAISDVFAAPIVSAHIMKNLVVAYEEMAETGDTRPLEAFVHLTGSPVQQRWTHRAAMEAVAFVTEGRIPKLLAP